MVIKKKLLKKNFKKKFDKMLENVFCQTFFKSLIYNENGFACDRNYNIFSSKYIL